MKNLLFRFPAVVFVAAFLLLFTAAFLQNGDLSTAMEQAIILLVSLILGFFPGMNIMNWIKEKLEVQDEVALLVVYAICGTVGALGVFISGQFLEIEWSWANVVSIAGIFLAGAKFAYQRLKSRTS